MILDEKAFAKVIFLEFLNLGQPDKSPWNFRNYIKQAGLSKLFWFFR